MILQKSGLLIIMLLLCTVPAGAQTTDESKTSAADYLEKIALDEGADSALDLFQDIRSDTASFVFDAAAFKNMGYRLRWKGEIDLAIAAIRMLLVLAPESSDAWDCMGEMFMYNGDKAWAVECYKKSLEYNPENENATWKLRMMDGRVSDINRETREKPAFAPGENTGLKGPYLGQKPPGTTPVVFAPGIVSTRGDFEYTPTLSPDGRALYFSSHSGLKVCWKEKDGWTMPQPAPFAQKHPGAFEPHITPDGKRMFFGLGMEIWVMDRTPIGWGEARRHGNGMYATTTKDGTLYVTDISTFSFGRIVRQLKMPGGYSEPDTVRGGVYHPAGAAHPCISHDESYIVFDSWREGTFGQADLFMCVRKSNGSWSEAIHLPAAVNTVGENICATLSPDGLYMFFTTNNDIYWVSTALLDKLALNAK